MSVHHKLEALAALLYPVRWNAARTGFRCQCRLHGSRGDSLSFRIHPLDDRIQGVCFGGCGIVDVLGALGLDLAALYPDRPRDNRMRRLPPIPFREALMCTANEAMYVLTVAGRIERGFTPTPEELDRLTTATARLTEVARITRAST